MTAIFVRLAFWAGIFAVACAKHAGHSQASLVAKAKAFWNECGWPG